MAKGIKKEYSVCEHTPRTDTMPYCPTLPWVPAFLLTIRGWVNEEQVWVLSQKAHQPLPKLLEAAVPTLFKRSPGPDLETQFQHLTNLHLGKAFLCGNRELQFSSFSRNPQLIVVILLIFQPLSWKFHFPQRMFKNCWFYSPNSL